MRAYFRVFLKKPLRVKEAFPVYPIWHAPMDAVDVEMKVKEPRTENVAGERANIGNEQS